MTRLVFVTCMLTLSMPAFAGDGAPEPSSQPAYHGDLLAADVAPAVLLLLAHSTKGSGADSLVEVGAGVALLAGPFVHGVLHHHGLRAAASLALRIGLPLLVGTLAGSSATPPEQCGDCDAQQNAELLGAGIGLVAAMVLDNALLAGEDDRDAPSVVPAVHTGQDGLLAVGLAGQF